MLALYSIKWNFDQSKIDLKEFDRLNDDPEEEIIEDNLNEIGDMSTNAKTACCNIF